MSLAGTRRQFSRSGDLRTFFRVAGTASAATNWPDGQPITTLNTLLLTAEEGISDAILPRFRIAGGDRSRFFALSHIPADDGPRLPSIPSDLGYINQIIAERKITILILDVLSSFLGRASPIHANPHAHRGCSLSERRRQQGSEGAAVVRNALRVRQLTSIPRN